LLTSVMTVVKSHSEAGEIPKNVHRIFQCLVDCLIETC